MVYIKIVIYLCVQSNNYIYLLYIVLYFICDMCTHQYIHIVDARIYCCIVTVSYTHLDVYKRQLQSSSSSGTGCRVGFRPSEIHRWRGTGGRRRKNAGSILRPFLPADSAPMSSERGEEMKCVRWRGDEECAKFSAGPGFID